MIRQLILASALALTACSEAAISAEAPEQSPAVTAPDIAAEDHPFGFMFGEWVGTASGRSQEGPFEVVQTERVGLMLGGDIVVINGTGYSESGEASFEAFGIISRNISGDGWQMTSWSGGRQGTFPLTLDGTDYSWELPAGPDAKMVYSATVNGDDWLSIGTYQREGMDPVETFRMTLKRTGDTAWPSGNPVQYR